MAKANNVEIDIVETEPAKGVTDDYLKINKLGKVPTFVGADGFTLHECVAIAIYSMCNLLQGRHEPSKAFQRHIIAMMKKSQTVIPVLIIHVDYY